MNPSLSCLPAWSARRRFLALAACLLAFTLPSHGVLGQKAGSTPKLPPPAAEKDLLALLTQAGNFKTLLNALQAAGMTGTLQKPGPYTLFAPTDEAFTKLPPGTLDNLLKPESKAKLVALLSYHIAPGKLSTADLAKSDELKTLEGTEVDVDASADGKTIELDDSKITKGDIPASNGMLDVIDTVLQP